MGYEDAEDLAHLRHNLAFKLTCGRLLESDDEPCSQPILSRFEMRRGLREAKDVDCVFDLAESKPLSAKVEAMADAVRTERAVTSQAVVRG